MHPLQLCFQNKDMNLFDVALVVYGCGRASWPSWISKFLFRAAGRAHGASTWRSLDTEEEQISYVSEEFILIVSTDTDTETNRTSCKNRRLFLISVPEARTPGLRIVHVTCTCPWSYVRRLGMNARVRTGFWWRVLSLRVCEWSDCTRGTSENHRTSSAELRLLEQ